MKHILTFGLLLLAATAQGQDDSIRYNRFSLDLQGGVNNPIAPLTPGYDAPTAGFFHAGLGTRFMVSPRFGLRLGVNYDQFSESRVSEEFLTHYYHATLDGVINLGSVLHFENWTDRFGLLMRGGIGFAIMHPDSAQETVDRMLRANFALTPQFKLSERWSIYLDAVAAAHVYQDYMYDFTRRQGSNRGFDGFVYNLSLGVQLNLGPHERHADWVPMISTRAQLEALEDRIDQMQRDMRDDDNDGVPNYLDEEPDTPAGSNVDSKGRTVVEEARDSDSDNIPDDVDDCPFEKGTPANRGCPDRSTGATGGANGYPTSSMVAMVENSEVKFATDKSEITPSFAEMLDGIAKVMNDNPSARLNITGHADDRASEEYNRALSQRRADAVRSYLMQKGISGDRLTTTAKGETEPKVRSTSVEARAENRRVEFDIR